MKVYITNHKLVFNRSKELPEDYWDCIWPRTWALNLSASVSESVTYRADASGHIYLTSITEGDS